MRFHEDNLNNKLSVSNKIVYIPLKYPGLIPCLKQHNRKTFFSLKTKSQDKIT